MWLCSPGQNLGLETCQRINVVLAIEPETIILSKEDRRNLLLYANVVSPYPDCSLVIMKVSIHRHMPALIAAVLVRHAESKASPKSSAQPKAHTGRGTSVSE